VEVEEDHITFKVADLSASATDRPQDAIHLGNIVHEKRTQLTTWKEITTPR